MTRLFFCQNDSPDERIILAKRQHGHSYTFWTMLILICSLFANFGKHPLLRKSILFFHSLIWDFSWKLSCRIRIGCWVRWVSNILNQKDCYLFFKLLPFFIILVLLFRSIVSTSHDKDWVSCPAVWHASTHWHKIFFKVKVIFVCFLMKINRLHFFNYAFCCFFNMWSPTT